MVFDGLIKFFNRIGGMTVDSSKKVGEGVSVPVDRFGKIRSKTEAIRSKTNNFRYGRMSTSSKSTVKRTSPRVIEKMRMDKDEIEIFKELIDNKYDRGGDKSAKDKNKKDDSFHKASLEELLNQDEKQELEPRMIMVIGGVSFVVVFMLMIVLGFGIIMGAVFGLLY